jgi:ABC-type Fe3+ transport system permease subunit
MVVKAGTVRTLVGLFILAPILAAVLIGVLLLFGVDPDAISLPGHFVRERLAGLGWNAPDAVLVTTAIVWWAAVVLAWLGLRRLIRG